MTGQQGQQLSLCRPEKWRWWSPQHPLQTPPAAPRAVQTRTQGKGRPVQMHPSGILLGGYLGAMLLFLPSCISRCPRCLHCPMPLRPAQPCTRLCFGAQGRSTLQKCCPEKLLQSRPWGSIPPKFLRTQTSHVTPLPSTSGGNERSGAQLPPPVGWSRYCTKPLPSSLVPYWALRLKEGFAVGRVFVCLFSLVSF